MHWGRTCFLHAALALTVVLCAGCVQSSVIYDNTYDSPQQFYEGIYKADKHDLSGQELYRVRALILPHHLVASEDDAIALRTLALHPVDRIVLLSPDHYGRCPKDLCTTQG